ncbi:zinc-binding dehydrogenase [Gordonia terrae]|uniref:zinc-binding dehydrogenase n=1 Tax=Gordonia terrae TaxID=2055 RepID=UPI003F6C1E0A
MIATVEDFSQPAPGPGQVLIRTALTLVSPGTERAWLSTKSRFPFPGAGFPFHPGYSLIGRVEDVGHGCDPTRIGETVFTTNGGYGCHATRVAAAEELVFRVTDGTDPRKALFFAVADVAIAAVRRSRVELGESGVIVGLGLIGQLAVQAARAAGAVPVIGIDPDPHRRDLALRSGAHAVFSPDDRDGWRGAVSADGGADFTVDLAGGNGESLQLAIDAVGRFGRVIGAARTPEPVSLELNDGLMLKNASLSLMHILARPDADSRPGLWSLADQWAAYLKLLAVGSLDPLLLSGQELGPDALPAFYQDLVRGDSSPLATVVAW